jgi:hypothetical protein
MRKRVLDVSESKNPHIGSSLDDFLKEEGLYEDATDRKAMSVATRYREGRAAG